MSARWRLGLRSWMARATSSLPVPDSPWISTVAVEDQRLATKAADALVTHPIRASDPIVIAGHVFNEESLPARTDAADLPHAKGKSPERSIQPGPVSAAVQGRAGTRRQMKALGL